MDGRMRPQPPQDLLGMAAARLAIGGQPGSTSVANPQPARVSETAFQPSASAATSAVARKLIAWLSPIRARRGGPGAKVAPNQHGTTGAYRLGGVAGTARSGISSASGGAGVTSRSSSRFTHPSRAAAPKQRGAP